MLIKALDENEPLPTTTEGKTVPPTKDGETSNYDVIDNMGSFGMKYYDTMDKLWKEIQRSTTISVTTQDLKATKEGLRSEDLRPKSARSKV